MTRSLITVLITLLMSVTSGCSLNGGPIVRPQNQFTVVNNTNVPLRVTIAGYVVSEHLATLDDTSLAMYSFAEGQSIVVEARGYDEIGRVGIFKQEFTLTSGFRGTPFKPETIIVSCLQPVQNVVPSPENRAQLHDGKFGSNIRK